MINRRSFQMLAAGFLMAASLPVHVPAKFGEMGRLPRDCFGINQPRQVIVEPADNFIQAGCDFEGQRTASTRMRILAASSSA